MTKIDCLFTLVLHRCMVLKRNIISAIFILIAHFGKWHLTMDRSIKQDSELYPNRLKHYSEIYIGHTPTINFYKDKPMNAVNVWNIDTGAAFTGRLSAIDIDTKDIFQSDTLQDLYPDEQGRNKS